MHPVNKANEQAPVDERERALAATNLEVNYWVEAGAGTGKTALLVQRLRHIILTGSARLDEIAAITFTEKAAAELKNRLREELEQRLSGGREDEQERIQQALEELDVAAITTIHSFAAGLLRERPVEAGVDPLFKVLDEGELTDLQEQVWERWFGGRVEAEDPLLAQALFLDCPPDGIKRLAFMLYRQRDLIEVAECPEPPDLIPEFRQQLIAALAGLEQLLPNCRQQDDKGYQRLLLLLQQGRALLSLKEQQQQERYLLKHFQPVAVQGNKKNWHPPESCSLQKEICRNLKQAREDACRSITGRLVSRLTKWCRGYLEVLEEAKIKAAALDFQDLLLKARNLLLDSLPARAYFQQRFRHLLVDEFQDTDPLQVDLVFLLAEKEAKADRWDQVEMRPGKLFLVGDPKQSIYRFRRADIEIYQAAGAKLINQGDTLAITQNFRTLPGLIGWVNLVFEKLIQHIDGVQPEYRALSAFRSPSHQADLILLESEKTLEGGVAAARASEAEAVAALIKQAVGNWDVQDLTGLSRKLAYGDIALLFPTSTGLEHYEEALRSRGLPYRLEGGKLFFQQEEINALKNLLLCLANPYDSLALAATLKYWAGISDEELYFFLCSGAPLSYFHDPGEQFHALREAFLLFKEIHLKHNRQAVSSLVEELLERTWFWPRAGLNPAGAQAAANLRKAIQLSRLLEGRQPLTFIDLACRLERAAEQSRDEEESLLGEAEGNTIHLLTIHKAKGLEFPLVCLVNPGGGRRKLEPFLAQRRQHRYEVSLGAGFASSGYEKARADEEQRLQAEQIRLFYVAATRARDYLVLPRFYSPQSTGFWAHLEKLEADGLDLWAGCKRVQLDHLIKQYQVVETAVKTAETPNRDPNPEQIEQMLKKRDRFLKELRSVINRASAPAPYHSATELARTDYSPRSIYEAGPDQSTDDWSENRELFHTGAGSAFGSAFHQIMERIALDCADPAELEAIALEAARYWRVDDLNELLRLAGSVLKHPLLERVRRAERYFRELPFVLNLQGELIEGLIDLVFQEEGALVIVDYKTDHFFGPDQDKLWELYRRQGKIYALALAESAKIVVKEVSFLFVRSGVVRTIRDHHPDQLAQELLKKIKAGV